MTQKLAFRHSGVINSVVATTDIGDVTDVVYVQINVTNYPNLNCIVFPSPGQPQDIQAIYTTAKGQLPDGQNQADLDIDISEFKSGHMVAIAFNLNPATAGEYNYVYNGLTNAGFNPADAIYDSETDGTLSLTWITQDIPDPSGQTVVVVCPVVKTAESSVPYSLEVYKFAIATPGAAPIPLPIDPKIKNTGTGLKPLSNSRQ